ncbi:MAG TPA: hypothetical protein VGS19_34475 [Streptosporangiaceae bacterium]|nr:hypothetical protein [Streptosporangiaceae bacterium]
MADRAGWLDEMESELRALGQALEVPSPGDLTVAVRQRLTGQAAPNTGGHRHRPALGRIRGRLVWRAALVALITLLALLVATPQGRAVITHVFRFAGIELRQEPGPARPPGGRAALPGQRQMPLERARHQVSFPILVPAALGQPSQVVVSDGGRVVSLTYRRTPHGLVRVDEFAGYINQVVFEKLVHFSSVTRVRVDGTRALWVKGPQELLYVTRDGALAAASARLTTGNTLIWATRQVALRLEGNLSESAALVIADSAH